MKKNSMQFSSISRIKSHFSTRFEKCKVQCAQPVIALCHLVFLKLLSCGRQERVVVFYLKGGYLDFSHLPELKNICISEIYMKKEYKLSTIKNNKITNKKNFDGVSLKGYVAS